MATDIKYSDPPNMQDILEELKSLPTLGEVNTLINRVFPEWQVASLDGYCGFYPHLTNNWDIMCKRIGVKPTQILIVRELAFDDDHILLRTFVECLTRAGFSVKRMLDYVPCGKCDRIAVPTPQIYSVMKEKGVSVPDRNIPICKACR